MPISRRRKHLIIAIDGPAGSGKSTTAKLLAKKLKVPYIDTGAMYRSVTLKAMKEGVSFKDTPALVVISKKAKIEFKGGDPYKQKVYLDGKDVTGPIRTPELTKNVFYVARESRIRREMVKKQRRMGRVSGAVMEGRDIGTKVFPDADYKFYFLADAKVRATRRHKELLVGRVGAARRAAPTLAQVAKDIRKRDRHDKTRKEGPLKVAKGAMVIDTSPLTIEETVDKILAAIRANPLKAFELGRNVL